MRQIIRFARLIAVHRFSRNMSPSLGGRHTVFVFLMMKLLLKDKEGGAHVMNYNSRGSFGKGMNDPCLVAFLDRVLDHVNGVIDTSG